MSRWLVWIGCIAIIIGLVPTLADDLPVDLWGWLTDPAGRAHAGYMRVVPTEGGRGYSGDPFVVGGFVVLIAAMILKRSGR